MLLPLLIVGLIRPFQRVVLKTLCLCLIPFSSFPSKFFHRNARQRGVLTGLNSEGDFVAINGIKVYMNFPAGGDESPGDADDLRGFTNSSYIIERYRPTQPGEGQEISRDKFVPEFLNIDPVSGEVEHITSVYGPNAVHAGHALALDNDQNQFIIYGRPQPPLHSLDHLMIVDSITGEYLSKAEIDDSYWGLFTTSSGDLVGITWDYVTYEILELRHIDRYTGESEVIADLPYIDFFSTGSGAINLLNNQIYAHESEGRRIYVIDAYTGELLNTLDVGRNYVYLYVDYVV
ncbi:hypothetical protein CMO92_02480 [Candidatus Woesearchaeota archaeon]|nr:hypothetical protein [Candidatus Woesearchaeota archaeon]